MCLDVPGRGIFRQANLRLLVFGVFLLLEAGDERLFRVFCLFVWVRELVRGRGGDWSRAPEGCVSPAGGVYVMGEWCQETQDSSVYPGSARKGAARGAPWHCTRRSQTASRVPRGLCMS